jgi:hypothetical protein
MPMEVVEATSGKNRGFQPDRGFQVGSVKRIPPILRHSYIISSHLAASSKIRGRWTGIPRNPTVKRADGATDKFT